MQRMQINMMTKSLLWKDCVILWFEELKIGAPSDGQALPNERSLLEVMSSSLPGGGWLQKLMC